MSPTGSRRLEAGPWDPAEDALLGTAPDVEIAERLHRSVWAVSARRRHLGIRGPGRGVWTDEQLALLGTDSDGNIGRRIGKSAATVAQMRYARKIPAYKRPRGARTSVIAERAASSDADAVPWSDKEISWLGILTDQQIAERTGRTLPNIAATRRALRRQSVDEIVAAIARCEEKMVADVLCMWYGRMQSTPPIQTLIQGCGIQRATAYRHLARVKSAIRILWPDDAVGIADPEADKLVTDDEPPAEA